MLQELQKLYDMFVADYDRLPEGKKEEAYYAETGHPTKLLKKVKQDFVDAVPKFTEGLLFLCAVALVLCSCLRSLWVVQK